MGKANPDAPRLPLGIPGDIARIALGAFGVTAGGVTGIAVVESYSNLLAFARDHGLAGWRAAIAPGAVDSFIVMGELLLFAAILLHWGKGPHVLGAGMAVWGFLLSVSGNIWHAPLATMADRGVSAIWPVTATAGLAGGLIIVRQIMSASGTTTQMLHDSQGRRGRAAGTPLPPPARPRKEPRPGRPPGRRAGQAAAGRPDETAPAGIDETALLAELLTSGKPLPSVRALSLATAGIPRSRQVERVLELARARQNGGSHD
jgi:uncharacterized protein DUF2637